MSAGVAERRPHQPQRVVAPAPRVPSPVERNLAAGRWAIAGAPVGEPYPCRCRRDRECSPAWCECAGRTDLDAVPPRCCAHWHTPEVTAAARRTRRR